jgi:hypothetical protein
MYKYRKRPSGLTYNLTKVNPSWYQLGHTPWHKGLKGIHQSPDTEFKPGQRVSPATEFKPGEPPWNKGIIGVMPAGTSHHAYKGDEVSYASLHGWVKRVKGLPNTCEACGKDATHPDVFRVEWANKSHLYKRELDDWIALCMKCHRAYDKDSHGASVKRREQSCV